MFHYWKKQQSTVQLLHTVGINELKDIVEVMSDILVIEDNFFVVVGGTIKYFGILLEIVVWYGCIHSSDV